MSVTVTKSEGVTMFTLTSDPQSSWPPLCQIFKGLCYSPVCCSVSRHLRAAQGGSLSVLGTLQIMVGLLNIGLGAILCSTYGLFWWQLRDTFFPLWMGALFIVFGILCILSEKFPSPCLIIVTVILNLAGVAFAIAALVLYIINITLTGVWWDCEIDEHQHRYYYRTTPSTVPSEEQLIGIQQCKEGEALILSLLQSINSVLLVVSVLQICVSISSVVLGIKALKSRRHGDNESSKEIVKYYSSVDAGSGDPKA